MLAEILLTFPFTFHLLIGMSSHYFCVSSLLACFFFLVQEQSGSEWEPVSWCRAPTSSQTRAALRRPASCWHRGWDTFDFLRKNSYAKPCQVTWNKVFRSCVNRWCWCFSNPRHTLFICHFWFFSSQRAVCWLKLRPHHQCTSTDRPSTAREGTTQGIHTPIRYMSVYPSTLLVVQELLMS